MEHGKLIQEVEVRYRIVTIARWRFLLPLRSMWSIKGRRSVFFLSLSWKSTTCSIAPREGLWRKWHFSQGPGSLCNLWPLVGEEALPLGLLSVCGLLLNPSLCFCFSSLQRSLTLSWDWKMKSLCDDLNQMIVFYLDTEIIKQWPCSQILNVLLSNIGSHPLSHLHLWTIQSELVRHRVFVWQIRALCNKKMFFIELHWVCF